MRPAIYLVFGTRAQLVKMAPVLLELERRKISYRLVYTAQHRETIDELRLDFGVKEPDVVLGAETANEANRLGRGLGWVLRMFGVELWRSRGYLKKPGMVVTHGDTTTTVWAALAGKMNGCRVVHLESGLRSFCLWQPFPEEINRLLTFGLSDVYMCPGEWAAKNMRSYQGLVVNTNTNTLLDSLRLVIGAKAKVWGNALKERYALVSVHRFENVYNRKRMELLRWLIKKINDKGMKVKLVLHPLTRYRLEHYGWFNQLNDDPMIDLIPRMGYVDFVRILNGAQMVVSDGGSNQEELSYLGVPTLLFREYTERKEGLGKNVILSEYDKRKMIAFINHLNKYRGIKNLDSGSSASKIVVDWFEKELNDEK